jgi:hypothetical protein
MMFPATLLLATDVSEGAILAASLLEAAPEEAHR